MNLVITAFKVADKEIKASRAIDQVREKYAKTDFRLLHRKHRNRKVFLSHTIKHTRNSIFSLQIAASVIPLGKNMITGQIAMLQEEVAAMTFERDTLPLERCLFSIPHRTLPVAYHPHRTNLCLETGSILPDVWQYILHEQIKCRATLRLLRLVSVSFAIMLHSMDPCVTGYIFKL